MTNRIFADVIVGALLACPAVAQLPNRVNLKLDASQAEAVLTILDKRAHHEDVSDTDWQKLFDTVPYRRLKQRESSMRRPFTDEDFMKFVATLDARREQLRQTLQQWQSADLPAVARRPLAYLPPEASVRADIYPVIKPQSNSFVFEAATAPAIFLYLDPKKSRSAFENTVAHESHHIGLASLDAAYEEKIKSLPEDARKAGRWMGAFGEGLAVLAAAGSPDVPPMADFPERDQVRVDAPAVSHLFGPEALKAVEIPIQLWRASNDDQVPDAWNTALIRRELPKPAEEHVVTRAGHYAFLPPCSEALAQRAPQICTDDPSFDRAAFPSRLQPRSRCVLQENASSIALIGLIAKLACEGQSFRNPVREGLR